MKKELLEKLADTHTVLSQVKTSGDDTIAMAQGLLLLRQSIEMASRIPEEEGKNDV